MKGYKFNRKNIIITILFVIAQQACLASSSDRSDNIIRYINATLEQTDMSSFRRGDSFAIFAVDMLCSRTKEMLDILTKDVAVDNMCHLISIYDDSQNYLYPLLRKIQAMDEGRNCGKIQRAILDRLVGGEPDSLITACFLYISRKSSFERADVEDVFGRIPAIGNNVEASEWAYSILQHLLVYDPDLFIDVLRTESTQVQKSVLDILAMSDEPFSNAELDFVIFRVSSSKSGNDSLKEKIIDSLKMYYTLIKPVS